MYVGLKSLTKSDLNYQVSNIVQRDSVFALDAWLDIVHDFFYYSPSFFIQNILYSTFLSMPGHNAMVR